MLVANMYKRSERVRERVERGKREENKNISGTCKNKNDQKQS